MDYTDRLRLLALNDTRLAEGLVGSHLSHASELDPKTLALVRLAALVAVGGMTPSYGAQTDVAVAAGASADEIVAVLMSVADIVGLPRVVAAAPSLGLALGYDTDEALDR